MYMNLLCSYLEEGTSVEALAAWRKARELVQNSRCSPGGLCTTMSQSIGNKSNICFEPGFEPHYIYKNYAYPKFLHIPLLTFHLK